MTLRIGRRGLMTGGAGFAALAALGGRAAFAQGATRVRLLWWGSQARAERTEAVMALFAAAHPETAVEGESAGWDDYWPRLATQTAGGNAPDVIQMDYRYIFEYARRGALLPLDDMIASGAIDLSGFTPEAIAGGQVDGKTYGVSLGANSSTMLVNAAAFTDAGIEPPERGVTWDAFAERCAALTAAADRRGFYGTQDGGGVEPAFEAFLRQRGRALYGADGKVGFEPADAVAWFGMWAEMRESGACTPADIQALDLLNIETNMLTLGHSAVAFAHSNQLVGYQAVNEATLTMNPYPTGGPDSRPGQYLKPSMFFSIYNGSRVPEAAGAWINFCVNDPEAARSLGVERGVPESSAVRDMLASELDEASRLQIEYIEGLGDMAGTLPPPPPLGAGEIQFVLKRINEEVGFEAITPEEGGEALVAEAASILARG